MRFNGKNYKPVGHRNQGVNPITIGDFNGRKLQLVQSYNFGNSGQEEGPIPEAFNILSESSDNLQAENSDLLVLESAP